MTKGKIVSWGFVTLLLLSSCIEDPQGTILDTQMTTESSPIKNADSEASENADITTPPATFTGSPSSPSISTTLSRTPTQIVSQLPTASLVNSPVPPASTTSHEPIVTTSPTSQPSSYPLTIATGLELESSDVFQDKVVLMWKYQEKRETPDNRTWFALEVFREGDYGDQVVNKYWLSSGIYEIRSILAGNYTWRVIVYEGNLQGSQIETVVIEKFGTLYVHSDINPGQSQPQPTLPAYTPPEPTIEPTPTNIPYP